MIQTTGFVKPYPQDVLNGALGLNSLDVAQAIGYSHRHLMRDLNRRQYLKWLRNADFKLAPFGAKTGNRGRKSIVYAMDTETAKVIIAQSRTELGAGYLRYLIACEFAMEHQVPKMIAEIADLRLKLASLSKPKRVAGPGRRHKLLVGFRSMKDIFGNEEKIPVFRMLATVEMTDAERRAWEAQHCAKISRGASDKAAKLLNLEVEPGKGTLALIKSTT